jgi:thiol:disulfide interchange protein DsbD
MSGKLLCTEDPSRHSHAAGVPLESVAGAAASPLDALRALLDGGDDEEFLPPDEAFRFSAEPRHGALLSVRWQIADGYYLYRDKMRFALSNAVGISLGAVSLPEGEIKQDEHFGRVQIYRSHIELALPLTRTRGDEEAITLEARYQGCAEAGICYPPITKTVNLRLPAYEAANASGA